MRQFDEITTKKVKQIGQTGVIFSLFTHSDSSMCVVYQENRKEECSFAFTFDLNWQGHKCSKQLGFISSVQHMCWICGYSTLYLSSVCECEWVNKPIKRARQGFCQIARCSNQLQLGIIIQITSHWAFSCRRTADNKCRLLFTQLLRCSLTPIGLLDCNSLLAITPLILPRQTNIICFLNFCFNIEKQRWDYKCTLLSNVR